VQARQRLGASTPHADLVQAAKELLPEWDARHKELLQQSGDVSWTWTPEQYRLALQEMGCEQFAVVPFTRFTIEMYVHPDGCLITLDILKDPASPVRVSSVSIEFNWLAPADLCSAWSRAEELEQLGHAKGLASWGDAQMRERFARLHRVRLGTEGFWERDARGRVFVGNIRHLVGLDFHLSRLRLLGEGGFLWPLASPTWTIENIIMVGCRTYPKLLKKAPWILDLAQREQDSVVRSQQADLAQAASQTP
jgi:hypothetical protein